MKTKELRQAYYTATVSEFQKDVERGQYIEKMLLGGKFLLDTYNSETKSWEERHIIVDVVRSQTYVERLHLIVAVYDLHVAHLSLLLHRQEQVFLRFVNTIDAVVATEKMGLLRRGCHCKSYEKRRCRCAAEERFVHFYIGF